MGVDHIVNKQIIIILTPLKVTDIIRRIDFLSQITTTLEIDVPSPRLLLKCTIDC